MDNVNTTADKISRMYSEKYTEIQNIGRSLSEYEKDRTTMINTTALNAGETDCAYANGSGSIDNADFNNARIISLSGTETIKDTVIKNVTTDGFNAENVSLRNFVVDNAVINTGLDTELNNVVTDSLNASSIFGSTLENPYIESLSASGYVPSEYRPVINNSTFSDVLIENPDSDFEDAHVPELIANKGTVNELYVDTTKERISSSVGLMLDNKTGRIITAFPTVDDIVFEENRDYLYTSNEGNLLYGDSSHLIEESDNLITASGVYNACIGNYEIPEKVNDYFVPVYEDIDNALTERMNETTAPIQDNMNVVEGNLGINETSFNMLFRMYQEHAGFILNNFNQNLNEINSQVNDNFNDIEEDINTINSHMSPIPGNVSSLIVNAKDMANSWSIPAINDVWHGRGWDSNSIDYLKFKCNNIAFSMPANTQWNRLSESDGYGAVYIKIEQNGTNLATNNGRVLISSNVNIYADINGTGLNSIRFYGNSPRDVGYGNLTHGFPPLYDGMNCYYMFNSGRPTQHFYIPPNVNLCEEMFRKCSSNVDVTFSNEGLPLDTHYMFNGCFQQFNRNIQIPTRLFWATGMFYNCQYLNQNIYIPPQRFASDRFVYLNFAFFNCRNLRTVSLGFNNATLDYINYNHGYYIWKMFSLCVNLTSIYIPRAVPKSTSNEFYNILVNGAAYNGTTPPWTVYNTL